MSEETGIFDLVVWTDKLDYAPGEWATFTITGVTEGGTLELQVLHVTDPGPDGDYGTSDDVLGDNSGSGHEPFYVTDMTVEGTSDDQDPTPGTVVTSWYVNPDDSLNETFVVTATDLISGAIGAATFTDSTGITYEQWETIGGGVSGPQWANGQANPNQATYLEGDVVPHRVLLTGLEPNTTYGIIVDFDYYQQNTNAGGRLYLEEYDTSITDVTPARGSLTGDSTYTLTANDPSGGSYTSPQLEFFLGDQGDGEVIDVTSVTYQLLEDPPSANTFRRAEIIFKTDSDFAGTTDVDLYYGLRLALPGEAYDPVGGEIVDGAAGFTGGSLQTKIEGDDTTPGTINDDPSINWITPSNAIQLQPGVVLRGLISGYKWDDTDGDGEWDNDEVGLGDWTINLYKDTNDNDVLDDGDILYSTTVTSDGTVDVNGDGEVDPLGYYEFSSAAQPDNPLLRNDTLFVQEVLESGWEQTFPADPDYWGPLTITTETPQFIGEQGAGAEDLENAVGNFGNYLEPFPPAGLVTLEKYVSVDGGTTWHDADSPEGPQMVEGTGNPQFLFEILNASTVSVEVVLSDSIDDTNDESGTEADFNLDGLTGNDGSVLDGGAYTPGSTPYVDEDANATAGTYTVTIAPGSSVLVPYTGATWHEGQHTNIGRVDYASSTGPAYDEDPANYNGFQNIDLSGYKWIDSDGQGDWDASEAGANGWTIYLDDDTDPDNGVIRTDTTANDGSNDGAYSFQNINPSEIDGASTLYVYELLKDGYTKTYGEYNVSATSGTSVSGTYGVAEQGNIGNFELFDISGYKWNDADGDKVWDLDEQPIENWTIYLDSNNDGVPDLTASTDSNGYYEFTDLGPGSYDIWEEIKDGWAISYNGATTVVGSSGQNHRGTDGVAEPLNFGNLDLDSGYVTNSALCTFTDDLFRLVFTPDLKNWPDQYKLSDSNPGQFFYNLQFDESVDGDNDGSFDGETVEITIPFPFVTMGGNPVHVYDGVTGVVQDDGTICLDPGETLLSYGRDLEIEIKDYVATWEDVDGGTPGVYDEGIDNVIEYADTYTIEVDLSDLDNLSLTDDEVYINIHLDYGLEKTNGWSRSGENAINNTDVNPLLGDIAIPEGNPYGFDSTIDDSDYTVSNDNEFKNVKGFGGLVLYGQYDANGNGDYDDFGDITLGIEGAEVELYKLDKDGNPTTVNPLDTAFTDADGWYFMENFRHKGKLTDYYVKLVESDDTQTTEAGQVDYAEDQYITTVGRGDHFGEALFVIEPPSPLSVAGGNNNGEQSGADLREDMLIPAKAAAVLYWAMEGVDSDGLESLLNTDIRIEDLGGSLLGETSGSTITLDDDAAGYGWSDSLVGVDDGEIDLLSVLTHEFGHVLGYDHEFLGETLAVGERDLPGDDGQGDDTSLFGFNFDGDLLLI